MNLAATLSYHAAKGGTGIRTLRPAVAALPIFCLAALAAAAAAQAAAPRVVATISPIHSLTASVMEGVASPRLLIPGTASPHNYTLKPSDARALAQAQLIVWVGEEIEPFLEKPLAALRKKARVLELSKVPGVVLLPAREGGVWEGHADEEKEKGQGRDEKKETTGKKEERHEKDMHVWLSPANTKAIARALARALGEIDPANAPAYRANLEKFLARVDALDAELREQLKPVAGKPYIVFHDAYQYFERHYGLSPAGSISVTSAHTPGAKRLYEIRKKIVDSKVACVFREPQFDSKLVTTAVEGTPAKVGVLDPDGGATIPPGPGAYFRLMRNLAGSLRACLAPGS
ncbi:MAG: zinc ABC transporter substrate-binding protein ZnuA [Candidatus Tectomicrobia bacterium]|nr:zinc ABC transporter substrate-binding protein ZnuA [Candidatus Tectomicrobia bacterium]